MQAITDLLGLTSAFTYASSDVIAAVTTPYGTTTVTAGEAEIGLKRWVQTTDPIGGKERVEYGAASVFVAEPAPAMLTVANNNHHNSSYWGKRAMEIAPADPASATDYLVDHGAGRQLGEHGRAGRDQGGRSKIASGMPTRAPASSTAPPARRR